MGGARKMEWSIVRCDCAESDPEIPAPIHVPGCLRAHHRKALGGSPDNSDRSCRSPRDQRYFLWRGHFGKALSRQRRLDGSGRGGAWHLAADALPVRFRRPEISVFIRPAPDHRGKPLPPHRPPKPSPADRAKRVVEWENLQRRSVTPACVRVFNRSRSTAPIQGGFMCHRPLVYLAVVLLAAGAPAFACAQNSSSPAAAPA